MWSYSKWHIVILKALLRIETLSGAWLRMVQMITGSYILYVLRCWLCLQLLATFSVYCCQSYQCYCLDQICINFFFLAATSPVFVNSAPFSLYCLTRIGLRKNFSYRIRFQLWVAVELNMLWDLQALFWYGKLTGQFIWVSRYVCNKTFRRKIIYFYITP